MKKQIIMAICIGLLVLSCNRNSDNVKILKMKFSGYEDVIKNPDSIPEVVIDKSSLVTINLPVNLKNSQLNLDNLIDSIYYVKIETTNDCLIGNIDKLLFLGDNIIIAETLKRSVAYVFSKSGKFKFQIGKQGKGPGEYIRISAITVDKTLNEIIIYDGQGGKILYYDTNGSLLRTNKIYYHVSDFAILDDGTYLYTQTRNNNQHISGLGGFNLFFSEPNQSILGKALSNTCRDKYPDISFEYNNNFNQTNTSVLYTTIFSDTIYEVQDHCIINAKYYIDFKDKSILNELHSASTNKDYHNLLNNPNILYLDDFVTETSNYLYFSVGNGGECYFNKKTHKLVGGSSYTYSLLSKKIIMPREPVTTNDSFFVSVIWPYEFIDNNTMYMLLDNEIKNMLSDVSKNSNPILFFYSIKD